MIRVEVRRVYAEHEPAADGQRFALPAWIPGSYLIHDFARHIIAIAAESDGKPVRLVKCDKHTWQAAPAPLRQTTHRALHGLCLGS